MQRYEYNDGNRNLIHDLQRSRRTRHLVGALRRALRPIRHGRFLSRCLRDGAGQHRLYAPDNVGELLVLIERLTGRDYREAFPRGGSLPQSTTTASSSPSRFTRIVRHAIVVHVPGARDVPRDAPRVQALRPRGVRLPSIISSDTDELVAKLRRRVSRVARSARARGHGRVVSAAARCSATSSTCTISRPRCIEILRTVARHEGALPGGRHEDERSGDESASSERRKTNRRAEAEVGSREDALRVLELRTSQPTTNEIRESYRRLMRRFHPDINPAGLERAKIINNAYGLLIAQFD